MSIEPLVCPKCELEVRDTYKPEGWCYECIVANNTTPAEARALAAEAALATVLANAEVMWRWHEKYPNTRDANAKHWYAEWRASEQQAREIEAALALANQRIAALRRELGVAQDENKALTIDDAKYSQTSRGKLEAENERLRRLLKDLVFARHRVIPRRDKRYCGAWLDTSLDTCKFCAPYYAALAEPSAE